MATTSLSGLPVIGADGQPLDRIELRGLRATANHGVYVRERENPQEFVADLALFLDTRPAAEYDALSSSVNYAEVARAVGGVLTGPPVNLIETLAEQIAAAVLEFDGVSAVDVVLHKPGAELPVTADDVTVSIRRDLEKKKPVALVRRKVKLSEVELAPVFVGTMPSDDANPEDTWAEPVGLTAEDTWIEPEPTPEPEEEAFEPESEPEPLSISSAVDLRLDHVPSEPVAAVLGLGSNLGDSLEILRGAVTALDHATGVAVTDVGPLARTSAVGGPAGQDDYLNTVVAIQTTLSPRGLLSTLHRIEADYNRVRTEEWGPRTLDLDIITYGDLIVASDDLTIPHKLAHDRAFVLLPWSQMQPNAILPGPGGGPVAPLAVTAPDREGVRWLRLDWLDDGSGVAVAPAGPAVVAPAPEVESASEPDDYAPVGHAAVGYAAVEQQPAEYAPVIESPGLWDEPESPAPHPQVPEPPEALVEDPQTRVNFAPVSSYQHNDPSAGLWSIGAPEITPELLGASAAGSPIAVGPSPSAAPQVSHPESVGIKHPWSPTVPAAGEAEYPTFTGILHGAPSAHPGFGQAHPQHAEGVPSHSLPTFTGDIRAESPLAARAERVPLLKSADLKVPAYRSPVPEPVPERILPFTGPRPGAQGQTPEKPEPRVPSWDEILRG